MKNARLEFAELARLNPLEGKPSKKRDQSTRPVPKADITLEFPLPSSRTSKSSGFFDYRENKIWDQTQSPLSFMKSPQHRGNILDGDMDSAGIGVAEGNGQLFAVEDFGKAR